MAKTEALQIEREKTHREVRLREIERDTDLLRHLLENPILWVLIAFFVIEIAERRGYLNWIEASALQAGLVSIAVAKAIAPLLPTIYEGTRDIIQALPLT